ncbi:MAG: Beta-hexosaminidase [Candidatus Anoxychlamydiales bacterium]|nr:Beta-hexosaminidase [Candidatus Anoxychlamydiales bacterium]
MFRILCLSIILPFFLFSKSTSEKILDQMSLDEKIGQLFMLPACPKADENHLKDLEDVINKYHLGGVIVKQSDAETQINFLNHLQKVSKLPLFVSADAEWGLGMRMENTISFPKNMTLGAIQNDELLYEMGKEIAIELKAVGVHINFAPVIDINSNAKNPIINVRSFSDDKEIVAKKANLLMQGMQDQNIIACPKHFPGLGDVIVDPHLDIPIAYHNLGRLESIEFYPYDILINKNAKAIMTAHVLFPKLSNLPATLCKEILDILIKEKGFKNLLITDALNMKALTKYYHAGEIALLSHIAGNDILLYGAIGKASVDEIILDFFPKAFMALKQAYLEKELNEEKLNEHVLKILKAKEDLNLFENRHTPEYDPNIILNSKALKLKQKLYEEALTIYKNDGLLPVDLNNNVLYVTSSQNVAQSFIVKKLELQGIDCKSIYERHLDLSSKNLVILSIYESCVTEKLLDKIKILDPDNTIIFFFGSPYYLQDFKEFKNIVLAYQEDEDAYNAVLEYIFGNISANGRLPIDTKSL